MMYVLSVRDRRLNRRQNIAMSGKRAAGCVLIVIGVVAALWGINLMNSLGSQIAGAIGMHDNTGPLAIGGGAVLALIGLVLAVQKETMPPPSVQSVQAVLQGTQLATPSKMPPSMASPALLASLMAQSQIVAANFANEELLAVVVGHLQAGNKINAIKALREMTNCGLREGKDLVDEVDRAMKIATRGA
jgi:ribosomal protein L7/L12